MSANVLHRGAMSGIAAPTSRRAPVQRVGLAMCPNKHCITGSRLARGLCSTAEAPPVTTSVDLDATTTSGSDSELSQADLLSARYNLVMRDAMGWGDKPFSYDYSRGLYYHEIIPNLICGSQPRHKHDVNELKQDLQLTTIVSLQQDKDMHHWGVNPDEIRRACGKHGINLVRRPVRDFDPHSLRKVLPSAVQAVHEALQSGGRVYVHCTAGLGRAPGVIIAYLYWYCNFQLPDAYTHLTSIRPCGPKREAIRGATFDILSGQHMDAFGRLPEEAYLHLNDNDRRVLQQALAAGHRQ